MTDIQRLRAGEVARCRRLRNVGIGYTLATGRLFTSLAEFQRFAEGLLNRPILTHEFADEAVWVQLRARFEQAVSDASPEPTETDGGANVSGHEGERHTWGDFVSLKAQLKAEREEIRRLREELEKIKSVQPETVAMFRRREIVFATALGKPDDERTDAEMWEKIAFSIYSDLCEADALAAAALAFPAPDRPEGE